jgi:CheY-like chemotaxis protein
MKRVLIVEDDEYKLNGLVSAIRGLTRDIDIVTAMSFTTAVHLLKRQCFDLVVLDMSLPTFDATDAQAGGDAQGFGGRRIVRIAEEYGNSSPTILVTQFTVYEDLGESLTVGDLSTQIHEQLGEYFVGTVAYDRSSQDWIPVYQELVQKALSI